jgi:hypothetical protein
MVTHSRRQPESLPADQLIGHEVHAPAVIGTLSDRTSFASLNAFSPTRLSSPHSQAFFAVPDSARLNANAICSSVKCFFLIQKTHPFW